MFTQAVVDGGGEKCASQIRICGQNREASDVVCVRFPAISHKSRVFGGDQLSNAGHVCAVQDNIAAAVGSGIFSFINDDN